MANLCVGLVLNVRKKMAATAANEIKEKYLVLCNQREIRPHDYVVASLQKVAKDSMLSISDGLRLDLAGNNKSMTNVRLGDDDIDVLCQILSRSTAVTALDLRYNNFSDKGAKAVAKLIKESQSLTEVNVMCNELTEAGAESIAEALHSSKSLRSLKVNGNKIGNKGGMFFAQALQINNRLRELDLGDCDLKTESIIALATVLHQNKHLKALNLSRPLLFSLQEEVTIHISRMLRVNNTLRELHLAKYNLKDFGIERICEGLRDNYSLVYLNLSCNRISRDGAASIAKLLRLNTPLEILDLGFNRIESDGAKHISSAIATSNSNLKALVLTSNCIKGDGIIALATGLETNYTLSNLYIWGNDLDADACAAIGTLFRLKRIRPDNTDVKPYVVDGRTYLAEVSHGIRRFYYWTPSYGPDVVGMPDED